MINKKLEMVFSLSIFFLLIPFLVQGAPPVASWWGTVEIDGNSTTDGAIVEAFINSIVKGTTTVGAYTSGHYLLDVACTEGQNVTIKVYGIETKQSGQICSQGTSTELNLTMNKTANGVICTYAGGCTSGFCVDGYCCNEACDGTNEACNVTGSEGTCTSTATTTATTVAPSGGGAGAGAPSVVSETKTISSINAGETGTFTYTKSGTLGVQEIYVEVKSAVISAQIKIEESSKPSGATEAIATEKGSVYKYIKITKTNIDDADIDKVKIKFKVPKSWVDDNGIDPDNVALSRYTNGKWDKLPTTKLLEDTEYYYYEAESPGLSVFAIIGEKISVTTTIAATVATTTKTTVVTTTVSVTTTTPAMPLEIPTVENWMIIGITVVVISLIVIIIFLLAHRHPTLVKPPVPR